MNRRTLLAAAAGLVAGAPCPARAAPRLVWTRLSGRPAGGLPIAILPPATGPGPPPVIIFSHGYAARPTAFIRLVAPWVAAGFLLLMPEHLDSSARGAPRWPSFSELERYATLRIADIDAILTALPSLAAQAGVTPAADQIGFGGHSFGAWTAAVIAGARVFLPGGAEKSFADPRPSAFFLLAAPAVPPRADARHPFQGLARDSFAALTRPLLLIDGTLDDGPGAASYRERLAAYELSPPGEKYLGIARDSTHLTLAGIAPPADGPLDAIAARSLANAQALALPFWRAFVAGQRPSLAWLDGPAPYAIDPENFTFARRLG
jgi:predicted dienelactone hydrolase